MLLLSEDYSFLMVSSECFLKPGHAGFYSVLPLACLLCYWLVSRACRHGQVNHYRLLVADIAWKGPFTVSHPLTLEQVAAWFSARSRERRESSCVERWPLAMWMFPQVLQSVPSVGYVHTVSFCYLLICLPRF